MEAFIAIRRRAKENRDKLIAQADAEYADTLRRIAAIEQDITGREYSRRQTISSCVNQVLPSDRPFTIVDIIAGLEALDPGRVWRKHSVDGYMSRLRARGIVRRLRKSHGREAAQYVRVGVPVAAVPFEGQTLPQVMAEVLGKRAMTPTELVVAMLEAGYETLQTPAGLRTHVSTVLRKRKGFRMRGGKWAVSSKG